MVDFFELATGKTKDERIGEEIQELAARGQVTWAEMDVPMNSYERDHLLPALTDDAFLRMFVHCARNCQGSYRTYDWAVSNNYAPEAERRGIGVPLDETPEYAELGVSLPVARIEALRRILTLLVPYLRGVPNDVVQEVNRLFLLGRLGEVFEEMLWEGRK